MKTTAIFTFLLSFSLFAFNASPKKNYIVKLKEGERTNIFTNKVLSTYKMKKLGEIKSLGLVNISGTSAQMGMSFYSDFREQIEYIEEDFPIQAYSTPNDPSFPTQVQLNRIAREAAWEVTTGSKEVIVAVTDTGFNFDHPDLKNQVWTNPNEIPDNGKDDDENGYIDDVHGWNHAGDNNFPMDKQSHGSHVSGIIGAEGDNEIGMAGMNWKVTIMPSQFLDASGGGSTFDSIQSVVYAAENGARIINASWGGGSQSQALEDGIKLAQRYGSIVVAAAGNDRRNNDVFSSYPANYNVSNVISVAATTLSEDIASFSNYGLTSVHVGAPGDKVYSTVLGDEYKKLSGTSMAAPVVAGVGALMLAINPDLTWLQLRNGLIEATDKLASLNGRVASGGETNPKKALDILNNGFQVWPSEINVSATRGFQFVTYDEGDSGVTWSVSDPSIATIDANGNLSFAANEPASIVVTATNSAGESVSSQVTVHQQQENSGGCRSEDLIAGSNGPKSSAFPPIMTYSLIFGIYLLSSRLRRRRKA